MPISQDFALGALVVLALLYFNANEHLHGAEKATPAPGRFPGEPQLQMVKAEFPRFYRYPTEDTRRDGLRV